MEAPGVDSKRKRITGGILAVLTATIVACGSIQGSAGSGDAQRVGGGANYLSEDGNYGIGLSRPDINRDYPPQGAQVGGASDTDGALTDGYCPNWWCPPLAP
jgi:hypothetical protein